MADHERPIHRPVVLFGAVVAVATFALSADVVVLSPASAASAASKAVRTTKRSAKVIGKVTAKVTVPPSRTVRPSTTVPSSTTLPPTTPSSTTTLPPATTLPATTVAATPSDPLTTSRVAIATSAGIDVFPTAESFTRERILFGLQDSGAPAVFLVVGEQGDRFQVQLPIRPNGTTGWIEKRTVKTFTHEFRIQVSLNAHEILVTNGAATVLRTRIGVGRRAAPTPGGTYYTTQLLKTPNPAGAYGPYAYGLSGFSETLASFGGGEAVIGLHGTNRPDLLGGDVSSGCIRLANADITFLAGLLPIGVPVVIAP